MASGDASAEVSSLLESWAAARLLRDTIWVHTGDVVAHGAGPAHVQARLIDADGTKTADLFELVGVRRIDFLRLVAIQLVTHAAGPDEGFIETARLLAELLEAAIPHATGEEASGTRLHRVNLIVGESGVDTLGRENLIPGWEANAVVAAEDRPDLDRASIYVRHPGNFVGHAAAAVASAAGLWGKVQGGVLDTVLADSTTADCDVVVLRTSVRAVVGEDPAETVVREAMALAVEDPSGPAPMLEWARASSDPVALSRRAAAHILSGEDWREASPVVAPQPRQRVRGFAAAFGDAVRFNAHMFRFGGSLLVRSGRRAIENAATGALVGRGGDTLVRYGAATADSMFDLARRRLDVEDDRFRRESMEESIESIPAPRPQTWRDLRTMCFGLVDGGPLSEGFAAPERAGLRELAPPAAVAPEPGQYFDLGQDGRLITDPLSALVARAEISTRLEAARAADEAERATSPEEGSADTAGMDVELVEAELRELDRWIEGQRNSVTWQVGESVASRLTALAALQGEMPDVPLPPHNDRLRNAEKTLRLWWWFALLLFLAGAGYAFWHVWSASQLQQEENLVDLMWVVVLTVLVPLAVAVFANHRYYREVRRYEWATDNTLADWRLARETQLVARREHARLSLLYEALTEWSGIIAHLVHERRAPVPRSASNVPDDVVAALPASVAVATVVSEGGAPKRAAMQAVRIIRPSGWISGQFEELVDAQDGLAGRDGGFAAADLDSSSSPLSPRRQLLEACRRGDSARLASERAIARVKEAVADHRLEVPGRVVERVGRFADGVAMSEPEFFRTILGPATPYSVDQWNPTGLVAARHVPTRTVAWVPRVDGSTKAPPGMDVGETTGAVALRADISRRSTTADLVIFRPLPERSEPETSEGPGGEVDW